MTQRGAFDVKSSGSKRTRVPNIEKNDKQTNKKVIKKGKVQPMRCNQVSRQQNMSDF